MSIRTNIFQNENFFFEIYMKLEIKIVYFENNFWGFAFFLNHATYQFSLK